MNLHDLQEHGNFGKVGDDDAASLSETRSSLMCSSGVHLRSNSSQAEGQAAFGDSEGGARQHQAEHAGHDGCH